VTWITGVEIAGSGAAVEQAARSPARHACFFGVIRITVRHSLPAPYWLWKEDTWKPL